MNSSGDTCCLGVRVRKISPPLQPGNNSSTATERRTTLQQLPSATVVVLREHAPMSAEFRPPLLPRLMLHLAGAHVCFVCARPALISDFVSPRLLCLASAVLSIAYLLSIDVLAAFASLT